jgi:hypothetical protein
MNDAKPKKGRRPIASTGAMSSAERARRARSKDLIALTNLCLSDISVSGLISLLPKLFANEKSKGLAGLVLAELQARLG